MWTTFALALTVCAGAGAWWGDEQDEQAASRETRRFIADQLASVSERGATLHAVKRSAAEPIELESYTLVSGPVRIAGSIRNASGLTYHAGRNSLFLVQNEPTQILELALDGTLQRIVPLQGFRDTEGITHIAGDVFAVIEERNRRVCFVRLPGDGSPILHEEALAVQTDLDPAGNAGPEGISFDPWRGELFLVKERSPSRVYRLARPLADETPCTATPLWSPRSGPRRLRDLGGVYLDPPTGHLLILNDKPPSVVECTTDGREIGRLWLRGGWAGLTFDVPQAEGITMDSAGNLYVCSEPNLLYVFGRRGHHASDPCVREPARLALGIDESATPQPQRAR